MFGDQHIDETGMKGHDDRAVALLKDVLPVWLSLMHLTDPMNLDPEWAEGWYEAAKEMVDEREPGS